MVHFIGNLASIVKPGHIFVISGRTSVDGTRLDINFKTDKTNAALIPLHLSVRFEDEIIVRNTKCAYGWGPEERDRHLSDEAMPNPIVLGELFKFNIFVGDNRLHIAINDHVYCTYKCRLPIENVRTLEITKDVTEILQVDHRTVYPTPWPMVHSDVPKSPIMFSGDIPIKLESGHVIILTATPKGNPGGTFTIFMSDTCLLKQALRFNVRFEPTFYVILNAMDNYSKFGNDERFDEFPFALDEEFKLAIACSTECFHFAVNGVYLKSFSYRFTVLSRLNGLRISTGKDLHLDISGVDHVKMNEEDCEGFEVFSDKNI